MFFSLLKFTFTLGFPQVTPLVFKKFKELLGIPPAEKIVKKLSNLSYLSEECSGLSLVDGRLEDEKKQKMAHLIIRNNGEEEDCQNNETFKRK